MEKLTKPPQPHYQEASLIKKLDELGIGRPSTYASIISKIIDRNYVKIRNVEGFRKESVQMVLTKKKKDIKFSSQTKEIVIG